MSSTIGNNLKVTLFGESHGLGVGCVIDNFPAGFTPEMDIVNAFMERRRPGKAIGVTLRDEPDKVEILSGIHNGRTTGTPITAFIKNIAMRSSDYDDLANVPRPGHADFTEWVRSKGCNDSRGGGHSSGRITAGLCFAGALAKDYLEREKGIIVHSFIRSIGGCEISSKRDNQGLSEDARMLIREVQSAGDSIGGVVGCVIRGFPAGIGSPIFNGIENRIAQGIFGVPAVKGIEFGNGFEASRLRGSQNNDPFYVDDNRVKTRGNNHGGILGGISSGMDITFSVAIKPTPSIAIEQESVNLQTMDNCRIAIKGRHDACIVTRAVPCIEAVAAIVALDLLFD